MISRRDTRKEDRGRLATKRTKIEEKFREGIGEIEGELEVVKSVSFGIQNAEKERGKRRI